MSFKVNIFTIFPEIFPGYLNFSIIGRALKKNIWNLNIINIRDYTTDNRKTVDDTPYGGGAGMIMKSDIIANAIDNNVTNISKVKFLYPSPKGKTLNQNKIIQLSKEKELAIICGRYEGIDQRVIEEYNMEEISVGDYIVSGGELPTMIIIDSIVRNLPNVLGNNKSLEEESFSFNSQHKDLVEYPQYTKPAIWRKKESSRYFTFW